MVDRGNSQPTDPKVKFAAALRSLHLEAGKPSARAIALRAGDISHTSVNDTLTGKRIPSWAVVEKVIRGLDGDVSQFRELWKAMATSDTDALQSLNGAYRQQLVRQFGNLQILDFNARRSAPIESLYVERKVTAEASGETISANAEWLERNSKHAVILGPPGSGKTALTHWITYIHAKNESLRTPFLIHLREFAGDSLPQQSILEYLTNNINAVYQVDLPERLILEYFESGSALVIFDGLDEILDLSDRHLAVQVIELFSFRFPRCSILITSRTAGYSQVRLDNDIFDTYHLNEFSSSDAASYLERRYQAHPGQVPRLSSELLLSNLTQADHLTGNPLFLSMLINLYSYTGSIPKRVTAVYRNWLDLAVYQWDRSRGIRTRSSLLEQQLARPALQDIALRMINGQLPSQLTATSLRNSLESLLETMTDAPTAEASLELVETITQRIGILTEVGATDSGEPLYGFSHRTMLEYLAAHSLARHSNSPTELAGALVENAKLAGWQPVAELAIQIFGESSEDGAMRTLAAMQAVADRLPTDDQRHAQQLIDHLYQTQRS
ncbi:NACHT domain-containing protein [Kribbella ginsengisoli]|uniref:NACHT domain-containing protein n=1 Tax=Kribbella ginsengisoli TaxID=363865 RepID=A0ABP6XFP7_9ACTN